MLGLSPLWNAALHAGADPVIQAGGLYLIDDRTRYVQPGLSFARAQQVFGVQADGSLAAYTGAQVPWEAQGVRLDPGWVQSFLQTHLLNNAAWGLTGLQAPTKTALGPNGANDSWALTETTSAATGTGGGQGVACVAGQPYTIKAVVSSRTGNRFFGVVFTAAGFGGNLAANINPSDGTVTVNSGSITAGSRQLANGNWEFWATATATATGSFGVLFRLSTAQTLYFPNYTGDGVSGVNVHALNFTNTAYPVPLTVATGLAVTVPAFSFSGLLADMGITLGSEYTLGMEYEVINRVANQFPPVAQLRVGAAGGSNVTTGFFAHPNGSQFAIVRNTADIYIQQSGASGLTRSVLRVKDGAFRAASNGALAPAGASGVQPPGLTAMQIGRDGAGAVCAAMFIRKLWMTPTLGLPDAQVQALSAIT